MNQLPNSRRSKSEEPENHERWLVSYADFITLLFAFFVVMYATSQKDIQKEKSFENNFRKQFRMQAAMGGPGAQNMGEIFEPIDEFPSQGAGPAEVEDYLERKLEKNLSKEEKQIANLKHDSIGARISLAAATFFQTGSAALKVDSLKTLDSIATILKESNNRLIIEGHTDDLPIQNGHYPSNWELGSARATKIVRYLIERHRFNPKQLIALTYADQRPLVPNSSEQNRAKNRRIEILIVTDEKLKL